MKSRPDNDTVLALVGIVRASLRALRTALADLAFAPENVRRVANEAETLSGALGRLDRMVAAGPAWNPSEPAKPASPFTIQDVTTLLARIQRLREPDGRCPDCGGVRL